MDTPPSLGWSAGRADSRRRYLDMVRGHSMRETEGALTRETSEIAGRGRSPEHQFHCLSRSTHGEPRGATSDETPIPGVLPVPDLADEERPAFGRLRLVVDVDRMVQDGALVILAKEVLMLLMWVLQRN